MSRLQIRQNEPFSPGLLRFCTTLVFPVVCKCKSGGTFGVACGTGVLFSETRTGTKFINEQFWGRAARAFMTRESRNARYFFSAPLGPLFDQTTSQDLM